MAIFIRIRRLWRPNSSTSNRSADRARCHRHHAGRTL